jgi:hypothetical protein
VHLDALFDRGWLTFDDTGEGVLSPLVGSGTIDALWLAGRPLKLNRVASRHLPYLRYHQEHVFQST